MIVTNYAGEVVEWTGTESEALAAGLNVNCTNCRYCRYCTDCTDCPVQPKANLVTEVFVVTVRQDNTTKIGCQDWTAEEWLSFSEDRIAGMSGDALEFMRLWKPVILAIVNQPAKETT